VLRLESRGSDDPTEKSTLLIRDNAPPGKEAVIFQEIIEVINSQEKAFFRTSIFRF
jgi:hypothetical protein